MREPQPLEPAEAILNAFERFPLVGLGEQHWVENGVDLLTGLLPRLAAKASDLVLECGSALYQPQVDRYIAGETVEIERAWRDTTQPGAWDPPMYARLYEAARGTGLRVLLADPPIDWTRIETPADLLPWAEARDFFAAELVARESLARGRKALLFFGAAHVMHGSPGIVGQLEQRGYRAFTVLPHAGLEGWPVPSLALLEGTRLGALDAPQPNFGLKLEQAADACLYLGPLRQSRPPAELYDGKYGAEVKRRRGIILRLLKPVS